MGGGSRAAALLGVLFACACVPPASPSAEDGSTTAATGTPATAEVNNYDDHTDKVPGLPTLYEYYTEGGVRSGLETPSAESFVLNGKNINLHSGALHYFRVPPQYWRDRLRRMRAAGLNAVETYVPWNLHNPVPGQFDFGDGGAPWSSWLDVAAFARAARDEDLLLLVRPGPYICAEWEFGGLPHWLLRDPNMAVRTSYAGYTAAVRNYFERLLPILAPFHFLHGGPIVALQLENEYGSFFVDDKPYLAFLHSMMQDAGLHGLFFTSDSPLMSGERGALPGVLQTANFQVQPEDQLNQLRRLQPDKPAMVMEYWTGWFDHWTEEHHTRSVHEFGDVLRRILAYPASVNMYMFHGGTNWGFMNGANTQVFFPTYQPDVTSYDYDAPLNEAGDYTDKWYATKQLLEEFQPVKTRLPSPPKNLTKAAPSPSAVTASLPLAALVEQVPAGERVHTERVTPMELLDLAGGVGQAVGFILYRRAGAVLPENATLTVRGRVRDLAIVLVDGRRATPVLSSREQFKGFGYWEQEDASMQLPEDMSGGDGGHTLDILVENWGRVNFGKPSAFHQLKGLVSGPVEVDGTPLFNWETVTLQFHAQWLQNLQNWKPATTQEELDSPTLFRTELNVGRPVDTWLDMRGWGKGVVFVNGFPLGRYFHLGPTHTIYLPAPLQQEGTNEILIFELYQSSAQLNFSDHPIL